MSLGLALARDLAAQHRATRCLATITCDRCLLIEVLDKLDKGPLWNLGMNLLIAGLVEEVGLVALALRRVDEYKGIYGDQP